MSRLKHSFKGYLRLMQMSRTQVFVFVEGKTCDSYFYGKISESVCQPLGIRDEICLAQQLPGASGGKKALINWYKYLRRNSALIDNFKGKVTGVIFFMDKDIDDHLGTRCKSNNVIYTKYYDVENHIFREGDLAKAVAAAASLDHRLVKAGIGNDEDWRRRAAECWKEWVKLCLCAQKHKIRAASNYGVTSRINNPLYGPVDSNAYLQHLKAIESGSRLSSADFKKAFLRVSSLVDTIYLRGEHDRIFKGKWYSLLLEEEAKKIAATHPINSNGLSGRLLATVALTLDFNKPWADHFKVPLQSLVNKL